jgi:hypothetical protein
MVWPETQTNTPARLMTQVRIPTMRAEHRPVLVPDPTVAENPANADKRSISLISCSQDWHTPLGRIPISTANDERAPMMQRKSLPCRRPPRRNAGMLLNRPEGEPDVPGSVRMGAERCSPPSGGSFRPFLEGGMQDRLVASRRCRAASLLRATAPVRQPAPCRRPAQASRRYYTFSTTRRALHGQIRAGRCSLVRATSRQETPCRNVASTLAAPQPHRVGEALRGMPTARQQQG